MNIKNIGQRDFYRIYGALRAEKDRQIADKKRYSDLPGGYESDIPERCESEIEALSILMDRLMTNFKENH